MRNAIRVWLGRGWWVWMIGVGVIAAAGCPPAAAFDIEGVPGSTWGQTTYENQSLTGPGAQGYLNQGIDWVTLPGGVTVNTFAEARFRLREKNKAYFNAYGPALGLELRKSHLKLGADYYWERFPELSESSNRVQYYLSWYYEWDLKHPKR